MFSSASSAGVKPLPSGCLLLLVAEWQGIAADLVVGIGSSSSTPSAAPMTISPQAMRLPILGQPGREAWMGTRTGLGGWVVGCTVWWRASYAPISGEGMEPVWSDATYRYQGASIHSPCQPFRMTSPAPSISHTLCPVSPPSLLCSQGHRTFLQLQHPRGGHWASRQRLVHIPAFVLTGRTAAAAVRHVQPAPGRQLPVAAGGPLRAVLVQPHTWVHGGCLNPPASTPNKP